MLPVSPVCTDKQEKVTRRRAASGTLAFKASPQAIPLNPGFQLSLE
jgi:hypothetical protein